MEPVFKVLIQTSAICLFLNACGGGSSSTTTINYPPVTPTNLTVTDYDGYTRLQWDPVGNATQYNIYWSTQSGVNQTNGHQFSSRQNTIYDGALSNGQTYYYVVSAQNSGGESGISNEVAGHPVEGDGSYDPLYGNQWHLNSGDALKEGINVGPVWNSCGDNTCRGEGIRLAMVDDGIEVNHPDLLANIATGLSYNYVDGSSDPTPTDPGDGHGTSVAGIIAARDYNNEGVRGVAPRANLVGYNFLSDPTLSAGADALTRGGPDVDISSNSWGPPDNTGQLYALPLAWKTAIDTGLSSGRHGLGTIYVWAAGNGGYMGYNGILDNSNYDGQANYRGVIAVAAVNDHGMESYYSEPGANILISAPGGEDCTTAAITTTDLTGDAGLNNNSTSYDYPDKDYTACMNGTSAATPMVSGAVALMLQANPRLGWRDVRYILATTARMNDDKDSDWYINNAGAGYPVNHKYGFGVVDATAAVAKASDPSWQNLGPQQTYASVVKGVNEAIPDKDATGISSYIKVTAPNDITKIESVEVVFSATHPYSGDLQVTLTSPSGTASILAATHLCDGQCSPYNAWVFSSVRLLDEAAAGTWTLDVADGKSGDTGTFNSWQLKIYGH